MDNCEKELFKLKIVEMVMVTLRILVAERNRRPFSIIEKLSTPRKNRNKFGGFSNFIGRFINNAAFCPAF